MMFKSLDQSQSGVSRRSQVVESGEVGVMPLKGAAFGAKNQYLPRLSAASRE